MSRGGGEDEPSESWERFGVELTGGRRCEVTVGAGCCRDIGSGGRPGWRDVALVADDTVDRLHGDALARALEARVGRLVRCRFSAGEASKTREIKQRLEDELLAAGVGRDGCIVALGGGVTSDLAGFVAATYLRGIDSVLVPTTLLAQVDASVGGKTGVDTPRGKNLVGAFHHPVEVWVDPNYLLTLPVARFRDGLAELVKYGVVADASLFEWLERNAGALRRGAPLDAEPIARCLRIKAELVGADERERGVRRVLNFGHTVAHAIEAGSGWHWDHGAAVAVGMRVESQLATSRVGLPPADAERIGALLDALGLPRRCPEVAFDELVPFLMQDKKRGGAAELRFALPEAIGRMANPDGSWVVRAELDELRGLWERR